MYIKYISRYVMAFDCKGCNGNKGARIQNRELLSINFPFVHRLLHLDVAAAAAAASIAHCTMYTVQSHQMCGSVCTMQCAECWERIMQFSRGQILWFINIRCNVLCALCALVCRLVCYCCCRRNEHEPFIQFHCDCDSISLVLAEHDPHPYGISNCRCKNKCGDATATTTTTIFGKCYISYCGK